MALLMVLSVIAATSMLGWAMLSSSSVRSQVDANAADALEAQYLAESGASYAIYYLRYPAKSPVGVTAGANGSYYAGQSNLLLWPDARGRVGITATPLGGHAYRVRSTASVKGCARTVEADVVLTMKGFDVAVAAGINGDHTLTLNQLFDGPFTLKGTLDGPMGSIINSPTPVQAGNNVVPSKSELLLLSETGTSATGAGIAGATANDRTYTFEGRKYVAERCPTTVIGTLLTARPTLNPKNVWYSDSNVTFNNVTLNGVLVVRSQTLTLQGTNTFTAPAGMAAVVGKKIDLKNSAIAAARVTVNGLLYLEEKVTTSGTVRSDGLFKVDGALFVDGSFKFENVTSPVRVTYKPSVASVNNLTAATTVGGLNITRWASVD